MSKVINIERIEDTLIYKELKNRSDKRTEAFIAALPDICEEASDRIKLLPQYFQEYTLHDKTHFLRVSELMGKILGSQIHNLNSLELCLLILSAFFHDQGMLIEGNEVLQLEDNNDFIVFRDNWFLDHPNYKETLKQLESSSISETEIIRLSNMLAQIRAAMLTDYLRNNHGERSKKFILNTYSSDRRFEINGINISEMLSNICLSHVKPIDWISPINGLNYDENIGSFTINSIFLSYILRIADILDFDADRTPEILFKSIHFTSKVSSIEWKKHRSVQGWEISKDKIRYTMCFEHPSYEKTARIFLNWIDEELGSVISKIREFPKGVSHYVIDIPEKVDRSRIGPKNNSYIYHDLEFSLSRDEIVKLLLTDNLYKSPSILIRELLQNSLDAIRLRKASYSIGSLDWSEGKVSFRHYVDTNNEEILECYDNGCGMDEIIITQFLGKVGRSYYRSPEFERKRVELKAKGADFEPCSQFGIGFMSCFMFGDRIEILTRKDYGHGKEKGKPLFIEINGINGLILIKKGNEDQEIGTTIKIYNRQPLQCFDNFSDNLRLVTRLKGIALATEFPIYGQCEIEGIKGSVEIPIVIDKKQTFLEKLNITTTTTTIEINLSEIDPNLKGYLRQSFLVDKNKLPTIENQEASWKFLNSKKWNDQQHFENVICIRESGEQFSYNYHSYEDNSICIDGILVCGAPGRQEYADEVKLFLGNISAVATSEHPFTIDVRGKIKPELSPSREPLKHHSSFDFPFGWKHLQSLLSIGSGMLWERILDYNSQGMTIDTFWKLLMIYDGSLTNVRSKKLLNNLQIPYNQGKDWIKLSEINNYQIVNDKILINTLDDILTVDFPKEIQDLSKARRNSIDLNWWLSQLLVSISKIDFIDNKNSLVLRNTFNENERPSDNIGQQSMKPAIKYIDYNGLENDYIAATPFPNTVNKQCPIIHIGFKSRSLRHKSEIEEFSIVLATVITNLIDDLIKEKKPFSVDVSWRPLRYLSNLYSNIKWSKYEHEYKPPYKVYIGEGETIEITDEIFKKWGKYKTK